MAFIAMGFTGERADQYKLEYIAQFNAMDEALKHGTSPQLALKSNRFTKLPDGATQLTTYYKGKPVRLVLTGDAQPFIVVYDAMKAMGYDGRGCLPHTVLEDQRAVVNVSRNSPSHRTQLQAITVQGLKAWVKVSRKRGVKTFERFINREAVPELRERVATIPAAEPTPRIEPERVPEQTALPINEEPRPSVHALLTLAEMAHSQGSNGVYTDLLTRALDAVK